MKRKEARELARKQGMLKQMKEELNQKFVQKAEYKDNLLSLEMMNIHGNH